MRRLVILAFIMVVGFLQIVGCGSLIVTQKSVEWLAGRSGFTWQTHSIDGFEIYVEPGSVGAAQIDAIVADARGARETVRGYLDERPYEATVSIFVVDTRDRMKDLIGRRSNAMAYHTSNSLCLVWADTWRVGATHELLHVAAMNLWGVPQRWVNEGAAVDAAGPWRGQDAHAICKLLHSRGELPSLARLTRRFNDCPGMVSYPAAGSFVRYLRETHGLEALRQVWDGGRNALPSATGLDLDTLEAAWLAEIDQADAEGVVYDLE